MADESIENLDDLDWSEVESELQANREQILDQAESEGGNGNGNGNGHSNGNGHGTPAGDLDINFLLDVNLDIAVEVGRSQMQVQHLLELGQGSVVELQSTVGQPLDIRVNGKLVARGEIAVVNEKFAVRITDVVSPNDRFAFL